MSRTSRCAQVQPNAQFAAGTHLHGHGADRQRRGRLVRGADRRSAPRDAGCTSRMARRCPARFRWIRRSRSWRLPARWRRGCTRRSGARARRRLYWRVVGRRRAGHRAADGAARGITPCRLARVVRPVLAAACPTLRDVRSAVPRPPAPGPAGMPASGAGRRVRARSRLPAGLTGRRDRLRRSRLCAREHGGRGGSAARQLGLVAGSGSPRERASRSATEPPQTLPPASGRSAAPPHGRVEEAEWTRSAAAAGSSRPGDARASRKWRRRRSAGISRWEEASEGERGRCCRRSRWRRRSRPARR